MNKLATEDNFDKYPQIIRKLVRNARLAKKMGSKNRKDVVRYFSWDRIAKELSNTYRIFIANYRYSLRNKSGIDAIVVHDVTPTDDCSQDDVTPPDVEP